MDIILVGEDEVTRKIMERLIKEYRKDIQIIRREPVRGGQIKKLAPNYNKLKSPVFLLTDLDSEECPPSLIKNWLDNSEKSPYLLFRVAYGEAESWLMADKTNFSNYLEIDQNSIPSIYNIDRKNKENIEIKYEYKPSLFLMKELAAQSKNNSIKEGLTPKNLAKKGPTYNSTLSPFIEKYWNPNVAKENSYSLKKTIQRLIEFNPV